MAAYLLIIFWIYKEVKLVVKRVAVMISSISRITILFLVITLFLVVPGLAQEEEEFFEEEFDEEFMGDEEFLDDDEGFLDEEDTFLEGDEFGEDIDHQIVDLVYKRLSERYEMPNFEDIQNTLLIAYSIINAIFTLSYRRHQTITDDYIQEANTAFIAYLRCYLPEKLPRKNR